MYVSSYKNYKNLLSLVKEWNINRTIEENYRYFVKVENLVFFTPKQYIFALNGSIVQKYVKLGSLIEKYLSITFWLQNFYWTFSSIVYHKLFIISLLP